MKQKLEILLTRLHRYFTHLDRIGIVWYSMLAYLLVILTTVFGYTVINHAFFTSVADGQQKATIKNPVSRGSIYSSDSSLHGVVAVSTNLGTLAIDPTQTGSTDKLLDFLADAVIMEFCDKTQPECIVDIGNYVKQDLTVQTGLTMDTLKTDIKTYLKRRIDTPIESVLVEENLNESAVNAINALNDPSLFFVVNNLYVNPTTVANADALATSLTSILGTNKADMLADLAIRKKRHLEILNKMGIDTRDFVNNRITTEQAAIKSGQLKQGESIYTFIKIEDNLVRYYPEGSAMGQISGFVDNEWVGKYGIEGYFQNDLQWENPIQIVTKDIQWRPIRDYASGGNLAIKSGVDITLTIDRNIQKEISKKLERAVRSYRADKWSVIVMDPKTGAVIAMANYPNYDPNNFTDIYDMEPVNYSVYPNPSYDLFGVPMFVVDTMSGTLSANIDGKRLKLRDATSEEINNFAIQKYKYVNKFGLANYKNDVVWDLYEPGSVFKAVTVAIGLDSGEIKPSDVYYDKWSVQLDMGNGVIAKISNIAHQCLGANTYAHALNWSCNVGMVSIIQKIGKSLFYNYLQAFGFDSKTNITLDGEVFSQITPYEKWPRIQFLNMSFGQGIDVTLLQLAAAYNVLANGGIYMQPYIVESIVYPNGKKIQTAPNPIRRVIKEETAKTITAMLVDGVKNGFAKTGGIPGYAIAGKTGTSQIPYKWGYENILLGSDIGHTITSFGGYAPAYNPKFVLIVSLQRPRSATYSETTSSPLFADIAQYLLNYYKVPRWQ